MKIDRISINNFRGASQHVDIVFDDRPITLIFGENGTGKSTITDAFDFVCNGKLGSLDNMSVGTKARSYSSTIGSTPDAIKIEIQSTGNVWAAQYAGKEIVVKPSSVCPTASILRRSEITKLITAQPSKRFEELQKFVSVPIIDHSETSLRKALDQKKEEYHNISIKLEQAQSTLEQIYQDEKHEGGDYLKWAETESIKDVTTLEITVKECDKITKANEQLKQRMEQWNSSKKDIEEKKTKHQKTRQELDEVLQKTATQSVEMLEVLKSALSYVQKNISIAECPVCKQQVVPDKLKTDLEVRIMSMDNLTQAVKAEKSALDALNKEKILGDQNWKNLVASANDTLRLINTSTLPIIESIKQYTLKEEIRVCDNEFSEIGETQIQGLLKKLDSLVERIQLQRTAEQKSIDQSRIIRTNLRALKTNYDMGTTLSTLINKMETALNIHEKIRKQRIDEILYSLSDEIDSLYQTLHPGENIGKISLYLKDKARASLELDGKFENNNSIPPQAYYSESHLDTLGICIFLILAKYNNNDIVILDDVLTSVDSQHLDRFIDMLSSLTDHFEQIIVTTHYRIWRDRYRSGRGSLSNTQVIELGPWSLNNGILTRAFATDMQMLRGEISKADFDRQIIASKAGIILESILDFLTLTYHLKVRRYPRHEYTLVELADSFDKTIALVLKVIRKNSDGNIIEIPLEPIIKSATRWSWLRNCVGCHFSSIGGDVPDVEVLDFGKAVLDLSDAIICQKCMSLPTKKTSGSHWECKCQNGTLVMHPMEHP